MNNPLDSESIELQMTGVLESFRNNSLSIGTLCVCMRACVYVGGHYGTVA